MAIKKPPKELSKFQKDYPRYKVVWQYEDRFKKRYAKGLGKSLDQVVKKMLEINKEVS